MTKKDLWSKVRMNKAISGKVVVFMKKSTQSGSTDIPPHERSIKITYKGDLLWKKEEIWK